MSPDLPPSPALPPNSDRSTRAALTRSLAVFYGIAFGGSVAVGLVLHSRGLTVESAPGLVAVAMWLPALGRFVAGRSVDRQWSSPWPLRRWGRPRWFVLCGPLLIVAAVFSLSYAIAVGIGVAQWSPRWDSPARIALNMAVNLGLGLPNGRGLRPRGRVRLARLPATAIGLRRHSLLLLTGRRALVDVAPAVDPVGRLSRRSIARFRTASVSGAGDAVERPVRLGLLPDRQRLAGGVVPRGPQPVVAKPLSGAVRRRAQPCVARRKRAAAARRIRLRGGCRAVVWPRAQKKLSGRSNQFRIRAGEFGVVFAGH